MRQKGRLTQAREAGPNGPSRSGDGPWAIAAPRSMIIYMAAPFARGAVWLARRSAAVLLALTVSGLTAGLVLYLAGAGRGGNVAWAVVGVCGAGYALWAMGEALARGRIGVDVIALLAVVGALAVGEPLARRAHLGHAEGAVSPLRRRARRSAPR